MRTTLYPDPGRRWESDEVRAFIREEYAIIESLSNEFDIKEMCEVVGVSHNGYYKWRKRDGVPEQGKDCRSW